MRYINTITITIKTLVGVHRFVYPNSNVIRSLSAGRPRSQGLSSSRPLSRSRGREEERPWERGWEEFSL